MRLWPGAHIRTGGGRFRLIVRLCLTAALLSPAACADRPPPPAVPYAALNARWQQAGDTAGPGQWSGADGTSSTVLPDGRVAWFFSDTYLGPVNPDGSRSSHHFVRNSLVVQDGDRLTTVHGATPVRPPWGVPGWYWVGGGHLENGRLVEFYHRFTGSLGWDFTEQGVAEATFELPSLKPVSVRELPSSQAAPGRTPMMWGSALLDDGDWTYIYGYRAHLDRRSHPKWLAVARAPRGHLSDLPSWQYDTGSGWSADPSRAAELPTRVDSGFGVLRVGGGFALVTHRVSGSIGDGAMMAYLADSPAGPFRASDSAVIYHAPEPRAGAYVYEARVHPQLDGHGQVIVSYNVNSDLVDAFCVPQNLRQASVYRPRFVAVPIAAFRKGYVAPPARGPTTGPGWFTTCPRNH